MTLLAWLAVAAYVLHVVEEHILGWYEWARKTMSISMDWDHYVTTEFAIVVLGIVAASLSGVALIGPMLVVAFVTLLLINVVFFHLLPMLASGGKFSPGIISGVILFLPIAYCTFRDQALPQSWLIGGVALGIAVILWPMLLLKLRDQPYIRGVAAARPAKRARRK